MRTAVAICLILLFFAAPLFATGPADPEVRKQVHVLKKAMDILMQELEVLLLTTKRIERNPEFHRAIEEFLRKLTEIRIMLEDIIK